MKTYLAGLALILGGIASVSAQTTYDTAFLSGNDFTNQYVSGGFAATLGGPALHPFLPGIYNTEAGVMNLTFSQPVSSISFDIGGIDVIHNDQIIFGQAPTLGPSLDTSMYYQGAVTLTGTTLTSTVNGGGARVTFSGLPGITSFSWTDAGTDVGSDSVLYDNFSFTTVPEPSSLILTAMGGLGGLVLWRRRK